MLRSSSSRKSKAPARESSRNLGRKLSTVDAKTSSMKMVLSHLDVVDNDFHTKSSGFDLSRPPPVPYQPPPIDDDDNDDEEDDLDSEYEGEKLNHNNGKHTPANNSDEEDSDEFCWETTVVRARRIDRSDQVTHDDDDDETIGAPLYRTIGVIPAKPPELPVRSKAQRYGKARVVTEADRNTERHKRSLLVGRGGGALAAGFVRREQDARARELRTAERMRELVTVSAAPAPAAATGDAPSVVDAASIGGATARENSPASEGPSRRRALDVRKVIDDFKRPIDDTRGLLEHFVMRDNNDPYHGVPLPILISHVASMGNIVSALRVSLLDIDSRRTALHDRYGVVNGDASTLSSYERITYDESVAGLDAEEWDKKQQLQDVLVRFQSRRDDALERTSADLFKTLDAYNSTFNDLIKTSPEATALEALAELVQPFSLQVLADRDEPHPKQPTDMGPSHLIRTLLSLAERADLATRSGGPFDRLLQRTLKEIGNAGCNVDMAPNKGFRRATEKAQAEYAGDYLMLNDIARCTIVVPRMSTAYDCAKWLIEGVDSARGAQANLPLFQVLYVKDRLSPRFDADANKSYRYLLIVGQLGCDGSQMLNVEIAIHIKRLYEYKKRLHNLYEWRKIIGEEVEASYAGTLTKEVIQRAARGIILNLSCPRQRKSVGKSEQEALAAVLQRAPCYIQSLDLTSCSGFEGVNLSDHLLFSADREELACVRLRSLRLPGLGLCGKIPLGLSSCTRLEVLELHDNNLLGNIPETFSKLAMLTTLSLHGNKLDGDVPTEALSALSRLSMLTLGGDLGGNEGLRVSRTALKSLEQALPSHAEVCPPSNITEGADQPGSKGEAIGSEAVPSTNVEREASKTIVGQRADEISSSVSRTSGPGIPFLPNDPSSEVEVAAAHSQTNAPKQVKREPSVHTTPRVQSPKRSPTGKAASPRSDSFIKPAWSSPRRKAMDHNSADAASGGNAFGVRLRKSKVGTAGAVPTKDLSQLP